MRKGAWYGDGKTFAGTGTRALFPKRSGTAYIYAESLGARRPVSCALAYWRTLEGVAPIGYRSMGPSGRGHEMTTPPRCDNARGQAGVGANSTELRHVDISIADSEPEHRGDRRRFLVWACMAGFVGPERVVERILQDLERETSYEGSV